MFLIVSRTSWRMSMYVSVVISPATTTRPVVISVSQATRLAGSSASAASSTASEIWSAILSGCPSVTDSDVKRKVRAAIRRRRVAKARRRSVGRDVHDEVLHVAAARAVHERRGQRREVALQLRRDRLARQRREAFDERQRVLGVDVEEALVRVRHPRALDGVLEERVVGELAGGR